MTRLTIGSVWLVECQRCANDATSFEKAPDAARAEFTAAGWADDFCPACNGAGR